MLESGREVVSEGTERAVALGKGVRVNAEKAIRQALQSLADLGHDVSTRPLRIEQGGSTLSI